MEKKTRTMFTKKSMIIDLKKMREDLIENEMTTTQIHLKYHSIYNYKIFQILVLKNYIKMTKQEGKKKFYRWNFDRKFNYNLFDFLFSNALQAKTEIHERNKKVNKNVILEEPQIKSINSNPKFKNTGMFLAKQIRKDGENWFDALKRANEILRVKKLKRVKEQIENYQEKVVEDENIISKDSETKKSQVEETQKVELEKIQELKVEKEDFSILTKVESGFKMDNVEYVVFEKANYLMLIEKLKHEKKNQLIIQELQDKIKDLQNQPSYLIHNPVSLQDVTTEEKKPKYLKLFGIKIYEKN